MATSRLIIVVLLKMENILKLLLIVFNMLIPLKWKKLLLMGWETYWKLKRETL